MPVIHTGDWTFTVLFLSCIMTSGCQSGEHPPIDQLSPKVIEAVDRDRSFTRGNVAQIDSQEREFLELERKFHDSLRKNVLRPFSIISITHLSGKESQVFFNTSHVGNGTDGVESAINRANACDDQLILVGSNCESTISFDRYWNRCKKEIREKQIQHFNYKGQQPLGFVPCFYRRFEYYFIHTGEYWREVKSQECIENSIYEKRDKPHSILILCDEGGALSFPAFFSDSEYSHIALASLECFHNEPILIRYDDHPGN